LNPRRIKISFNTINDHNHTIINKDNISLTNQRVKEVMKKVIRDFEKKETESKQRAALLVLNS
jgi:hypothetical protein